MTIIFFLIIISLSLFLISIIIFLWAVNKNQYEDLDYPAKKIIIDDNSQKIDD